MEIINRESFLVQMMIKELDVLNNRLQKSATTIVNDPI